MKLYCLNHFLKKLVNNLICCVTSVLLSTLMMQHKSNSLSQDIARLAFHLIVYKRRKKFINKTAISPIKCYGQ